MIVREIPSDRKEAPEYRNTTGRTAPEMVNKCASIQDYLFFLFSYLFKRQNCLKTNISLDC